jgi:Domain of unknown function (DUF4351)
LNLPLEGPQLEEFKHLLVTEKYKGIQPMATTWFEEGICHVVRRLLERKFGTLSPQVLARLESLSRERLEELSDALLDAESLEELGLEPDQPD